MKSIYSAIVNSLFPPLDPGEAFMLMDDATETYMITDDGDPQEITDISSAVALNGWYQYNIRVIVDTTAMSGLSTGTSIKVALYGGDSAGLSIQSAYVGHRAGSGDAWNFDGNQVQLTFNGGFAAAVAPTGDTILSDEIDFDFDNSVDLIVSVGVASDISQDDTYGTTVKSGYTTYQKASAYTEAGDTTQTGNILSGQALIALASIEVDGSESAYMVAE